MGMILWSTPLWNPGWSRWMVGHQWRRILTLIVNLNVVLLTMYWLLSIFRESLQVNKWLLVHLTWLLIKASMYWSLLILRLKRILDGGLIESQIINICWNNSLSESKKKKLYLSKNLHKTQKKIMNKNKMLKILVINKAWEKTQSNCLSFTTNKSQQMK